jgi:hypothetical protein
MIQKRLDDITEDDIAALVTNEVSEGRTIDYKRELPGNSDGEKKEFLADVSSFANTSGGDLVFGMEEDQGLPTKITGVPLADPDLEIGRLENIMASGLEPRIRYTTKIVTCRSGEKILIIRVERSWSGPHRVVFKGSDRFWGRHSTGKHPLDVNELRIAFTLSSAITDRIRAFRVDRLIALSNNQTPVPFAEGPKLVLHCIPVESFAVEPNYDLSQFYKQPLPLTPMGASYLDWRPNLEGIVAFSANLPAYTYTQLYRNGIIEVVDGSFVSAGSDGQLRIPSIAYEEEVLNYLPSCFRTLKELGVNVPIAVALALTNTRGLRMGDAHAFEAGNPIEKDTLVLPETLVQEFSMPIGKIVKPAFDMIWNACGHPSSKNFDAEGNWVRRR